MTFISVFLIGNEFTCSFRFLSLVTEEENMPLSSVLLKSHHDILKTCYIWYSVIHFVLVLPRGMSYIEIFCIGGVMGED